METKATAQICASTRVRARSYVFQLVEPNTVQIDRRHGRPRNRYLPNPWSFHPVFISTPALCLRPRRSLDNGTGPRGPVRLFPLFPRSLLPHAISFRYMESLYSIGLGLGLRFLIDTATKYHGLRVDGILIGLWEGIVLNHFARQSPSSFDPYIAFAFRMAIDVLLTRNISRMTVVTLWTGLGMVLSDVFPEVNHDKRFRRMTRPLRRWLKDPNLDFLDYIPPLPTFSELVDYFDPPRSRSRSRPSTSSRPIPPRRTVSRTDSNTTRARSPVGESFILTSRRRLPGNYTSETETTATNTNITTPVMSPSNPIIPPLRGILTPSRQSSITSPSPKPPSILASSRTPTSILSPPQSTTFFPPNSVLSSPMREIPSQIPRSGIISPPRSIPSTPRSILSAPRHTVHNPPIIQQPAPRHPPSTSIISPTLPAPSPSVASPLPPAQLPFSPPNNSPPGGRESDLEYSDIPYNHVPQNTIRQPRRFPQEAQSPPLVAPNFESIAMAMPEPQHEPAPVSSGDPDQNHSRRLSDIPEATQSQEASQVSRLSHISQLSSRLSQALSHLPPPSEHTTEEEEEELEYQSGLDSSQFGEQDAFTTPPNLAKGSVITDDHPIDDPLMTPPAKAGARNMTGIGSGFGESDRRRESDPSPQLQHLPLGALDNKNHATGRDFGSDDQPRQGARDAVSWPENPSLKGRIADEPTPTPIPTTKHKRTESSARPSMIPVRGNSVWGGSNLGISEPTVRPPPSSSVHGGGSVWGGSTKDEELDTNGVRDPAPKSNRGSIWGSIWGGSAKGEGSVRDDLSVREDIPVEPVRRETRESGRSRDRSVKTESVKPSRSVREPSAVRSTVSKASIRSDKPTLDSPTGERKRNSPQPLSRQPTGNGSVRGASALGSVKGELKPSEDASQLQQQQPERSIRGDRSEFNAVGDNTSVTGKPAKSALDDTKSSKGVEDVDAQKKLNNDDETGAPPTPAKSTTSISASASRWSENPRIPELPPLPILEGEFLKDTPVACRLKCILQNQRARSRKMLKV